MRLNGNPDMALKQDLQAMPCQCYIAYIFPVYLKSVVNAFNELQRSCRHFKDCFKWERENERERNTEQFADKQVTMAKGRRKGGASREPKTMAKRRNGETRKCENAWKVCK